MPTTVSSSSPRSSTRSSARSRSVRSTWPSERVHHRTMTGEEIVLGPLPKGVTLAGEGMRKKVWSVLGHTYWTKAASDSSFAFETYDPPGTGVPPHVHPTQDEHIYVLEGVFTLYLDGEWTTAGPATPYSCRATCRTRTTTGARPRRAACSG